MRLRSRLHGEGRFFIVSPWFLAVTAVLAGDAGGIPAQPGQTDEELAMMNWYGRGGMGSVGWLGMGLFWLLLLGLIIWLVVRLLPGSGSEPTRSTGESALDILDRRLASGDIDTEAWQAQRAALVSAQQDRK
jgi:putative membrane protein